MRRADHFSTATIVDHVRTLCDRVGTSKFSFICFLHHARDVHPDAFVERCRERTARRATLGADPSLAPCESLSLVELPYGYGDALAKLAHPLARAVRPDFLTGRHVAGAEEACERELGSIRAKRSVLAYDGESAEFAEIRPDGARVIEALRSAGSLGKLIERIDPGERVAREKIAAFSAELHRLGILRAERERPVAVRTGTSRS